MLAKSESKVRLRGIVAMAGNWCSEGGCRRIVVLSSKGGSMAFAHVAAAAGLVTVCLFPSSVFPVRDQESASGVGVIDVAKAFEQNPRFTKMKQDLEAMRGTYDEQLRNMGRSLKELEASIGTLDPDSEERRLKQLRYDLNAREADGMERVLEDRLDREVMVREIAIHEEIDLAVRRVADARGVKVVIKVTRVDAAGDPAKLSPSALRQRHGTVRSRDVLYAADELDLTGDVIKWLMVPPAKSEPVPKAK
jgi:Skp family chaperone for outer membrane proteins